MQNKQFNFGLCIFFFLLFLYPVSSYVIDGDTVSQENSFVRLEVTPHTARSPVGVFDQTFKVTNKMAQSGDLCVAYVFDSPLSESDIWLQKQKFKQVWESDDQCSMEQGGVNGTYEVCIDYGSYVNESLNYFDRVKQHMAHAVKDGKHVYYSNVPLNFQAYEDHVWKVRYKPSTGSGKWDLYGWNTISGSCINALNDPGDRNFFSNLDPWYNASYQYKRSIDCTNISGMPIAINGSYGFVIDSSPVQTVWTTCNGTGMALYYNNVTDYVVANDTALIPFDVENGNRSSYEWESVWGNMASVYHLRNTTDATANDQDLEADSGTPTQTDGVFGYGKNFSQNNDYDIQSYSHNIATRYTLQCWFKHTTDNHYLMALTKVDENQNLFGLRSKATGTVSMVSYISNTDYANGIGGSTNVRNTWALITGTYNGSQYKIYMNKSLENSNMPVAHNQNYGAFNKFYMAQTPWTNIYNGSLDECRVINRSLTGLEINMTWHNKMATSGFGDLGSQETGFNNPAIVNITTHPASIYTNTDGVFNITVIDLDGDNVTTFYNVSLSNGTLLFSGNGTNNFTVTVGSGNYSKNMTINISAIPYDGLYYGNIWENNVSFTVLNSPPTFLDITTSNVTTNVDGQFNITIFDADVDTVTTFYNVSLSNGTLLFSGNGTNNFTVTVGSGNYSKNMTINISAIPYDLQDYGNIWLNNVSFSVLNSLPVVTINYIPTTVYNNTNATVYVWVSDQDNDTVTSSYNVTVNGTSIASGSNTSNFSVELSSSLYDAGDTIIFSVTPFDGQDNGTQTNETISVVGTPAPAVAGADNFPIAVLILLPMLFGFMLLIAAITMNPEEHPALRIFLFLFALVMYFVSLHFGLVSIVEIYNYTALEELVGSTTYWTAIMFGVLIMYFLIYFIYNAFKMVGEKKAERWNY